MVSVVIGYQHDTLGTVAETPQGLVCDGPQKMEIERMLADLRQQYHLSDSDLIIALPRVLNNGYYWAHPLIPSEA